jgi:hypothetical protein
VRGRLLMVCEEGYQYHGGFFDYSPISLQAPCDDY